MSNRQEMWGGQCHPHVKVDHKHRQSSEEKLDSLNGDTWLRTQVVRLEMMRQLPQNEKVGKDSNWKACSV